jgi:hypothetical protein
MITRLATPKNHGDKQWDLKFLTYPEVIKKKSVTSQHWFKPVLGVRRVWWVRS